MLLFREWQEASRKKSKNSITFVENKDINKESVYREKDLTILTFYHILVHWCGKSPKHQRKQIHW